MLFEVGVTVTVGVRGVVTVTAAELVAVVYKESPL
jgi:hypothetical protein